MVSQIRRAAVSVPSNIAEGQGRKSTKELSQFLSHAKGSLCEVETQVEIALNLGFLIQPKAEALRSLTDEVGRMLNGLVRALDDPGPDRRRSDH